MATDWKEGEGRLSEDLSEERGTGLVKKKLFNNKKVLISIIVVLTYSVKKVLKFC